APPPLPPPPPPEPSPRVSTGAWIVTAVGGARLATGLVLGIIANGKHQSAVEQRDMAEADALQRDARGFARAANWSLVIGGGVALVGLVWIGVDLLRRPSRDARP